MAAPSGPTKLDTRENPFTQARRFGSLKLFLKVSLESVLGVIYIETSLLIPGIPRPQFLGSLRTTPKVRERGFTKHVLKYAIFFGFLQYV